MTPKPIHRHVKTRTPKNISSTRLFFFFFGLFCVSISCLDSPFFVGIGGGTGLTVDVWAVGVGKGTGIACGGAYFNFDNSIKAMNRHRLGLQQEDRVACNAQAYIFFVLQQLQLD